MKNEEYKKLSIAEFTKAAGRYESNHAGYSGRIREGVI